MNRVQFLDSLRRHLDDLPATQREEIVRAYDDHLTQAVADGTREADAVAQLGTPADCAAEARAGRLPAAPAAPQPTHHKGGNPFEPQMARRQTARRPARPVERPRHPEQPTGKKPWALVIVLTVAAVICVAFTVLRMLSSDEQLGYAQYETQYDLAAVQHIVVEDHNRSVSVKALTTSDVRVNYYEGHHERYELTLTDGTLTVRGVHERQWYDDFLALYDSVEPVLTLYLPPDFAGTLSLSTSNGTIEIADLTSLSALSLQTTNGMITATNLTAAGDLLLQTTNAPITAEALACGGALRMESANGALTLQGGSCQTLAMHSTNGTITFGDLSADIQSLELCTTNASVTGTLAGTAEDFTIRAETSNGRSNLSDRDGGPRALTIETSNGVIEVGFLP